MINALIRIDFYKITLCFFVFLFSCNHENRSMNHYKINDRIEYFPRNIKISDDLNFYVRGSNEDKISIKVNPSTKEKLIQSVNFLGETETKAQLDRQKLHSLVSFLPVYDYELIIEKNGRFFSSGFFIRNKTIICGYTNNYFDAQEFFMKESWKNVHKKFNSEYNEHIDNLNKKIL